MAEIIGTIASVVTLADVAIKVTKVKSLIISIKNVPQTIQSTVDQLEALNAVIAEVEVHTERDALHNTPAGSLSMRYCKVAVERLDELIRQLEANINSSGRLRRVAAKVKVVLDADSIAAAELQLHHALQVLQFALTLHSYSLTTLVPERTASLILSRDIGEKAKISGRHMATAAGNKIAAPIFSGLPAKRRPYWPQPSLLGGITSSSYSQVIHCSSGASEEMQTTRVRIQCPTWLSHRVWDVLVFQSLHGLTWNLSTWNIRPRDSPIFDAAELGSVQEVHELLASRNASLYDRDDEGRTLLHYATTNPDLSIAISLIHMGHPIFEVDRSGYLPYMTLVDERFRPLYDHETLLAYFHAIIRSDRFTAEMFDPQYYPYDHDDGVFDLTRFHAVGHSFQRHSGMCLWQAPGLMRLMDNELHWDFAVLPLATQLSYFDWCIVQLDALEQILSDNDIRLNDLKLALSYSFRHSLHNFVCRFILELGQRKRKEGLRYGFEATDLLSFRLKVERWRKIAQALLTDMSLDQLVNVASCEIFSLDLQVTPLVYAVLYAMVINFTFGFNTKYLSDEIQAFVTEVSQAGIDLVSYGEEEMASFISNEIVRSRRWGIMDHESPSSMSGPYLVSIKYGPKPEDWGFVWDEVVEEFAGEFWEMLSNQMPKLPGSWVD